MTLKECYQILKVDQSASLEDVKRAYRRRAFELHPDLNPHVRDASRQFQLLNEAYVILTRLVTARETAEQRRQEQPQDQSFASRWNSWTFSFGGKKTGKPDAAETKTESRTENTEERRAEREEAYREEMRREEARRREEKIRAMREEEARRERDREARKEQAEQERLEKERQEKESIEQERQEQERQEKARQAERRDIPPRPGSGNTGSSAGAGTTNAGTSATTGKSEKSEATAPPRPPRPGSDENLYAEQQEVLRDILNDSFARRVFEDIYSEIRKKGPQPEHTEAPRPDPSRKEQSRERTVLRPDAVSAPPSTPKSGFSFGLDQFGLDFSKGMGNTVKGWLRSQIDDEQTIRLPASGLFPGARVRLQIRRGLSDELTTLEVVLPTDFVVGKPIRLRGMGKRLGSVQGDLYLTVLSR